MNYWLLHLQFDSLMSRIMLWPLVRIVALPVVFYFADVFF